MPSNRRQKPNPAFRRRATTWPGSLREIYSYLYRNPRVRITDVRDSVEAEYRTTESHCGCRWLIFRTAKIQRYGVPVCGPAERMCCPGTGEWFTVEAGIVWDEESRPDLGITVEIGLDMVRIEYLK
jgi:hypothetical protein